MSDLNYVFKLRNRPQGRAQHADFEYVTEPIRRPGKGEVLTKVQYLSIDPTNRIWMSDMPQYMPPVKLGETMRGFGVGEVVESQSPHFKKGDKVQGLLGWQQYCTLHDSALNPLPPWDLNIDTYMGPLGITGLTAYFGLVKLSEPKAGETLVVSAAAGAVGNITGQIGKILGLKVIGLAGSAEKCAWLVEDLGFDQALNYKEPQLAQRLKSACPRGIDIYFENVGGEILDTVLPLMNLHSRIPLCGLIDSYNSTEAPQGPKHFAQVLMQRIKIQGFIITDFANEFPQALQSLKTWLDLGKIKSKATVIKGLEKAPEALDTLFTGGHIGKLYVEV